MKRDVLFTAIFCMGAFVVSCGAPLGGHPSSQLVEADGQTYTACGGAIWMLNEGNVKGGGSKSYEVIFVDPQGVRRDLKRVRILSVRKFPSEPAACLSPRK